ncbi:anhydro-N-acetylmuramic acid kinase-like [Mercenaria mercenaria]|uniref:anhydro-N-acetylmuramic acid kinase-like n=1 Tax=Mercenaria mercenaria TaxID=6596 RepID=UPI00234E4A50|nr:anhydro-N-acetylmuramic acid kinase-like [Mercenaria mercenaria]
MATFVGIGCMSGSSLDGLDICCVEFTGDVCSDLWGYRILTAETVPYATEWTDRLRDAAKLSGADLIKLHVDYGQFVGRTVSEFIEKNKLANVQFVSSHGHSVFHQPTDGFTFQLGDGQTTSTHLTIPYVCDFRTKDVCLGGQGAPLVPCGERFLFTNNEMCVNLGGIANIGIKGHSGYDVSTCNIVLNRLASQINGKFLFDKDGQLARSGKIVSEVLEKLNDLSYFRQPPPKSLWRDYIEKEVYPLLNREQYKVEDLLRTCTEHVALKVAEACIDAKELMPNNVSVPSVLFTGGGALNKFLIELINEKLEGKGFKVEKADEDTINFKEALIFAFLGLRCLLGEENVFREITGSSSDTISGSIHRPLPTRTAKPISLLNAR